MQHPLEDALEQAEDIIESVQQSPPKMDTSDGEKSLHQKLYEIYVEECEKEPENIQELKSNVNLLEKLVSRESLACLVVSLYPGKQGYSLMLRDKNGVCSETLPLPYEQEELLDYFDAEELPPILVDLLDKSQINIFHSGCVIAEIRDYRQSSNVSPPSFQSRHILLRPTMQSLASDIQSITSDSQKWSQEDKLLLESQLLLATAEPLCLDPSVAVACTENRLLYNKQKMNTPGMKRNLKRYSSSTLSRDKERSYPPYPKLSSLTFQTEKESETDEPYEDTFSIAVKHVDTWQQSSCALAAMSETDVEKQVTEKTLEKFDDEQPSTSLDREVRGDSLCGYEINDEYQKTKLTFMQSHNDPFISGERPHKKGRRKRWMSLPHSFTYDLSCTFIPGSDNDSGGEVSSSEELMQRNVSYLVQASGSSSPSLGQFSPEEERGQPETKSVTYSVVEKHAPVSIPSSSGDSFIPEQITCLQKSLSPLPAFVSPSLFQMSFVKVNQIITLPTATVCTATTLQRALFQTTVSSSQKTPVLSTLHESRAHAALPPLRSSTRAPMLSSIYSSRITSVLPAVSYSKDLPTTSSLDILQRNLALSTGSSKRSLDASTFSSFQTTQAPWVASFSQSTSTCCTSHALPETSGWSKAKSSKTSRDTSTDSSSQRSRHTLRTLAPATVSSTPWPLVPTTVRFSLGTLTLATAGSSPWPLDSATVSFSPGSLAPTTASSSFGNLATATGSSSPWPMDPTAVSFAVGSLAPATVGSSLGTLTPATVGSSKKTTTSTTVKSKQRTQSSSSAKSSLRTLAPSTVCSSQRALDPPTVDAPQQSSVVPMVISSQRTLPSHTLSSTAGLSLISTANPAYGAQSLVSGPSLGQAGSSIATVPLGATEFSSGQLLNVMPIAVQNTAQVVVQAAQPTLDNTSSLGSFTLVQASQGSFLLSTQQQPQQQPQLQLFRLIVQPQLQTLATSQPQQSESQHPGTQGVTVPEADGSAPQTVILNLADLGSFLQPQAIVLPQVVFSQSTPGQGLPQQSFQHPPIFQSQLQLPQPQQIHQVVPVTTTQSAHPALPSRARGRPPKDAKQRKPATPKF